MATNMAHFSFLDKTDLRMVERSTPTARGRSAAAARLLWPLAGPSTGVDRAAAGRPLRLLLRLLLASPRPSVEPSQQQR